MQSTECGYSYQYKTYGVVFFNGDKLSTCSPLSLSCVLFFWVLDFGVSKSSFEYDHEINKGLACNV